jgi:hypothetical protein
MILPWAHRLIPAGAHGLRRIPGQSVNLAHPLFGAHHAPRPLCLRATRCTPGGSPRGATGVGGHQQKCCHPRRRQPIGDLVPQSPLRSPLCAIASAGMTGWLKEAFYLELLCRRLCLRKGRVRVCSRKMGRQGVKSASPTRGARPLTPQLAH